MMRARWALFMFAAARWAAAAPRAQEEASRRLYAGSCTHMAFDTPKAIASGLAGATALAVVDVDGDATLDVASAGFLGDAVGWRRAARITHSSARAEGHA